MHLKNFAGNNTNRVNAASAPVTAAGPNLTNSTNSFNTASPSDTVVSPNFEIARKSSFIDPFNYFDDPDMPALEDIVYSDYEEDVSAEADLSNLETNISVSPIPTTRGHTQEEGIDYDEVFALVSRIEAIRLFLAYASFMGFMVYQMDVKSASLYGTIEEEVYVCQPPRFKDPDYPDKVYKVVKALYGLHQAPRAWYETLANYLLENGLQVKQKNDGIFISQDKYVAEILRKFSFTDVKSASTPIETEKPLLKDPDGEDVDVHIYRHFLTAVSYKLMLFGLTKDAVVHLMLLVQRGLRGTNAVVQWRLLSPALLQVENLTSLRGCIQTKGKIEAIDADEDIILVDMETQVDLEQDIIAQALEILKLKRRVKKLKKKRRSKSFGLKVKKGGGGEIAKIDANEDITLVDIETQVDLGDELQGRKDDVNAASKDVSAAEPTVFDGEEVTMTMAQTLIKMKAKKARLIDEQMAKRLHDEEENINWNAVAEQIQEKHLDNIRKYQSLKRKPVSIAQARKNMIIYLKNMAGYKMKHFRGMTYDKKRVAEETLLQKSFKKLKAVKVSGSESTHDTPTNDPKEMSEEDVKNMLEIFPVFEFKVEAIQVKLVKEKFSSAMPTEDKEKALWVELTRLFEPNADDVFWKLQRYMHDPLTWKLYTNYGVQHVSSIRRHDIFMLTEKDYPLSNAVMIIMLSAKLQVEEDSDMARDLVMKIFMEGNKPKSKRLDTSSKIMDTTQAQQKALDDALVAPTNRLKIGKCNLRLISTLKSKEPTLQVVLDALKLTPFYKAFEITTDVLKIYILFAATINKCLSGKTTCHDSLCLLRAKIIWGIYHNNNVDYVYLLWEDPVYQVENKNSKKNNDMCYPRFTKVIINYIMKKDLSIPRRNKMFWHTARDDPMFTMIRVISKHQTTHIHNAILPKQLTNQAMTESKAYKTYYAYATGEKTLKQKYVQKKAGSKTSPKNNPTQASKGKRLRVTAKTQFHSSQASGSGTHEETGVILGVPDVPTYGSDDEQISWKSSDDEDDDDQDDDNADDEFDNGQDDDNEHTESKNNGDDFVHPKLSTFGEEEEGDNVEEEKLDEEKTNEEEVNELYNDVNINLEGRDIEMTDALLPNVQATKVIEDTHFEDRVKALEDDFSKFKQTNLFAEAVSSIPANLSELELKKILIDKMESNKSINRLDQQKTLYKALTDAYETDKFILDTYGDTVMFKRCQDDEDDDEEPFAG
nr:putative ribonuclease H-like domain-containing protein [Tanacetum cinerariifolium]